MCITAAKPAAKGFLMLALQERAVLKASPELRAMGAEIIAETLPRLTPAQRDERWVAQAIAALGEIHYRTAEPVLQRILSERQQLLVPVWPRACRSAARTSLEQIRAAGGRA